MTQNSTDVVVIGLGPGATAARPAGGEVLGMLAPAVLGTEPG